MKINGKTILSTLSTSTNYVLKQSSTTGTLINSQIFDNGTNVGIGTTSPEVKLDIYGSGTIQHRLQSSSGGDIRFSVDSVGRLGTYSASSLLLLTSGTERMSIDTSGNVGIGTTSPSSILHLNSAVPFLSIQGSTTGSLRGINIMQGSTVFSSLSAEASAGETRLSAGFSGWGGFQTFYTNGSERIRITSAGNVGIGISSPDSSALLEIRSSTQGFLPPRMTTSERDNINSPANGLMIFNTDNEQVDVFANGSGWRTIAWV